MLNLRLFRLIRDQRLSVPVLRCFHHEFSAPDPKTKSTDPKNNDADDDGNTTQTAAGTAANVTNSMQRKYKVFRDQDAPEIFDVEEERQRNQYQTPDEPERRLNNDYVGLNVKRGRHGVFDIEDLVDVLRKENAEDIFVCSVPKELKYVDYMVVCSGRSYRHMLATAEFVRRMYKMKRGKSDVLPKIEGEKSRDWMAMDMGNIVLHIFSPKCREHYDLESLWSIGAEYDKECNKPEDPLVEMFETHAMLLAEAEATKTANK